MIQNARNAISYIHQMNNEMGNFCNICWPKLWVLDSILLTLTLLLLVRLEMIVFSADLCFTADVLVI